MEEFKTILQVVGQGGSSIIIFIIWYFTFKQSLKDTKDALDKHADLSENLLQLLKDEQDYKTHLAGILMRLEVNLASPLQCPLAKSSPERSKGGY